MVLFKRRRGRKKKRLENAPKSKQAFRGKQSALSEIEDEIYTYVMDLRKSDHMISTEMLQLEASEIA
jgi:hypothetical protein